MSNTDDATAGPSGSQDRLLPSYLYKEMPVDASLVEDDLTLYQITGNDFVRPQTPVHTSTPVKKSSLLTPSPSEPTPSPGTKRQRTPKTCRRTLSFNDSSIIMNDSASVDENEESNDEEDNVIDFVGMRNHTRKLRQYFVQEVYEGKVLCEGEYEVVNLEDGTCEIVIKNDGGVFCEGEYEVVNFEDCSYNTSVDDVDMDLKDNVDVTNKRIKNDNGVNEISAAPMDMKFCWSEDFASFKGHKETYSRVPGPTFSSNDPADIFCKIWDHEFMEMVVRETNRYAWEILSEYSDPNNGTKFPQYLNDWTEVTVEELYRYFAILILLSFCHRINREYWATGVMEMPKFRELMTRSRFNLINKFLHFVPNGKLLSRVHDRKIAKVLPVVDHCNRRFAELYIPSQYLSLDESLLLWKGRLSWKQCIRSKAARFGIKSFELCEATTGYLLQYRLYTGKNVEMHTKSLHGFHNKTAKIVLDLMEGYLDVGHVLVMDNWYNQLPLTRYLKTRRTDVLGTLNRRQIGIPPNIRDLTPSNMKRGSVVSRHCGDIALVAWHDVKIVTSISTYHQHKMVQTTRAAQEILKPAAIIEYNKYMGGVDLKDQKLSTFLMERKRNQKWYIKVFRRLLNISLLNAYIIYTKNPMFNMHTHRSFRMQVAEDLIRRFRRATPVKFFLKVNLEEAQKSTCRLQPGDHFPVHTPPISRPGRAKHKQMRCVRCNILKKRVCVTTKCKLCDVALCIGQCWQEYHTMSNLKKKTSSHHQILTSRTSVTKIL